MCGKSADCVDTVRVPPQKRLEEGHAVQDMALTLEDFTQVNVAINYRGHAKPPMHKDLFGNMVLCVRL
jgi:hypothetical protein